LKPYFLHIFDVFYVWLGFFICFAYLIAFLLWRQENTCCSASSRRFE